jgi:hypothetical protein
MERRLREASVYVRKPPKRNPYDSVLVVCEGAKTEPNYFKQVMRARGLGSMRIGDLKANDPMSIVQHGLRELERDDALERVFCVFDRDGHANFDDAVNVAKTSRMGRMGRLQVITSHPCFEVWILLHFGCHEKPFASSGGRSACANVLRAIQAHLPAYEKSLSSVSTELLKNVDTAIKNGQTLAQRNLKTQSPNPATDVHILLDYLLNLKR